MSTLYMSKPLPWPVAVVHDQIMDVSQYPVIYPDYVKGVELLKKRPGYRDLEIQFKQKAGALVKVPPLTLHVTGQAPEHIHVEQHSGYFATLVLDWRLSPSATDGTDLQFDLQYETRQGRLADAALFHVVRHMAGEILKRFEQHIAGIVVQAPEEVPSSKKRRRMPAYDLTS